MEKLKEIKKERSTYRPPKCLAIKGKQTFIYFSLFKLFKLFLHIIWVFWPLQSLFLKSQNALDVFYVPQSPRLFLIYSQKSNPGSRREYFLLFLPNSSVPLCCRRFILICSYYCLFWNLIDILCGRTSCTNCSLIDGMLLKSTISVMQLPILFIVIQTVSEKTIQWDFHIQEKNEV